MLLQCMCPLGVFMWCVRVHNSVHTSRPGVVWGFFVPGVSCLPSSPKPNATHPYPAWRQYHLAPDPFDDLTVETEIDGLVHLPHPFAGHVAVLVKDKPRLPM